MPSHSYPIRFLRVNCSKPKAMLRKSRFWISIRGPAIWNNFVANSGKKLNLVLFLHKPLDFKNELTFFWNKNKGYFCFVSLLYYCYYYYIIVIITITFIFKIIFIIFIIIRIFIKSSLLFSWGKLTFWLCSFQFLHLS